ncbi:MAG: hypothetical protein JWM19_2027 [Actinomycetia bacterium]|nr:hypothetical protein [Actinomycetes bacterium]
MATKISGGAAQGAPERRSADQRIRSALGVLFPVPAEVGPRSLDLRLAGVALQVGTIVLGAGLLLVRIPGLPPWDSLYLDDYGTFFVRALEHPWQLFSPQHGYVQVLPHVIAQLATYVPLSRVPEVFALSGALIASACGLYVFHASAGHIQSVTLRGLLAEAIVLLPIAPLELADNTLGAPWYMLLALFWGVFWRPRTRTGTAVTAVLAFVTAASTSIAVLFAPLLAIRVYALRRPREHAVTAGWLAGCLAQLPVIISSYSGGKSPLDNPSASGMSLSFYAHDVVLPSLGWHLSWWLQSFAGRDGATAIVAVVLAAVFGLIVITQPQSRLFVTIALLAGFAITVFSTTLVSYNSTTPAVTPNREFGARYTALPIFLIEAAIIVGADCALRQWGRKHLRSIAAWRPGLRPLTAMAVMALVAVMAVSWVPDFRYQNAIRINYTTGAWEKIVAQWRLDCSVAWKGEINVRAIRAIPRDQMIPCDRLRF